MNVLTFEQDQANSATGLSEGAVVTHSFVNSPEGKGRPKALAQTSGSCVVVGASDGCLRWWDIGDGSSAAPAPDTAGPLPSSPPPPAPPPSPSPELVCAVEASPAPGVKPSAISSLAALDGGSIVAAGVGGGYITLWTTVDAGATTTTASSAEVGGKVVVGGVGLARSARRVGGACMRGPHTDVWALAELGQSGKGSLLASAHGNAGYDPGGEEEGVDGSVVIWRWATGERLQTLLGHALNVSALAAFPGGSAIASTGDGGSIHVWDIDSSEGPEGGFARSFLGVDSGEDSGEALTAGNTLAAEDHGDYRPRTLKKVIPRSHSKEIWDMKLTPCGRFLVAASVDSRVRVWDTSSWKCRAVLNHPLGVRSVAVAVLPTETTPPSALPRNKREGPRDIPRHQRVNLAVISGDTEGGTRVWYVPAKYGGVCEPQAAE